MKRIKEDFYWCGIKGTGPKNARVQGANSDDVVCALMRQDTNTPRGCLGEQGRVPYDGVYRSTKDCLTIVLEPERKRERRAPIAGRPIYPNLEFKHPKQTGLKADVASASFLGYALEVNNLQNLFVLLCNMPRHTAESSLI